MRRQIRNQQKMWYSLLEENAVVYERDKDGNIIYDTMKDGTKVPRTTGRRKDMYSAPVEFWGNISASGGVAESQPYGMDLSDYDAILYSPKGRLPLTETSRIWYKTTPVLKNGEVDPNSADYKVCRVPPALDEVRYLLKGLV